MLKKILVVLDGAGDLPHKVLKGRTPFESANTPNLDFFAKNGKLGYMYPIKEKVIPGSDNALISIFGNDPNKCRRGVYEAIGAGFKLVKGDLAVRTNFGTIDNLKNKKVIDRRAGRTLTSNEAEILTKDLNRKIKIGCEFNLKSTVQHRGVLVLQGGFSDNISNIDPEWSNSGKEIFNYSKPLDDDRNSEHTANIINEFVYHSFNLLNNHPINTARVRKGLFPANMIFMRGFGTDIPKINKYKSWMSINSMPLEIGIAKASGMKNFSFNMPPMKNIDVYDNLYTSLNTKIKYSVNILKRNYKDFLGCYVHFKECDVPGHDNKPLDKKKMLEIIDKDFFGFLRKFAEDKNIKVVVTCDHSTPCKLKAHSSDPVPVLVYGEGADNTERFSEKESRKGSLGKMFGKDFMKKTGLNQ